MLLGININPVRHPSRRLSPVINPVRAHSPVPNLVPNRASNPVCGHHSYLVCNRVCSRHLLPAWSHQILQRRRILYRHHPSRHFQYHHRSLQHRVRSRVRSRVLSRVLSLAWSPACSQVCSLACSPHLLPACSPHLNRQILQAKITMKFW